MRERHYLYKFVVPIILLIIFFVYGVSGSHVRYNSDVCDSYQDALYEPWSNGLPSGVLNNNWVKVVVNNGGNLPVKAIVYDSSNNFMYYYASNREDVFVNPSYDGPFLYWAYLVKEGDTGYGYCGFLADAPDGEEYTNFEEGYGINTGYGGCFGDGSNNGNTYGECKLPLNWSSGDVYIYAWNGPGSSPTRNCEWLHYKLHRAIYYKPKFVASAGNYLFSEDSQSWLYFYVIDINKNTTSLSNSTAPVNYTYTVKCFDSSNNQIYYETESYGYFDDTYSHLFNIDIPSKVSNCSITAKGVPLYGDTVSKTFTISSTSISNNWLDLKLKPISPVTFVCGYYISFRKEFPTWLAYSIQMGGSDYGFNASTFKVSIQKWNDWGSSNFEQYWTYGEDQEKPSTCYSSSESPCNGACGNCSPAIINDGINPSYNKSFYNGLYSLTLETKDSKGTTYGSNVLNLWIDSTPPSVSITSLSFDQTTQKEDISFSSHDNESGISYAIIKVTDNVGNVVDEIYKDVSTPNCNKYNISPGGGGGGGGGGGHAFIEARLRENITRGEVSILPILEAASNSNGVVKYNDTISIDTSKLSPCKEYTVSIIVCDYAGNCGSASTSFYNSPPSDTTPPTISLEPSTPRKVINNSNWAISNSSSILLNWSASDEHGIRNVTLCLDGECTTEYYAPSCDNCSLLCGFGVTGNKTMGPGRHTITLIAEDAYGNVATLTRKYLIDPYPPAVQINRPWDWDIVSNRLNVSWSASDSISGIEKQEILVYNASDPGNPLIYNESLPSDVRNKEILLPSGYYNVTVVVKAWDYLENMGKSEINLTVDGIPPDVEILYPADGANVTNSTAYINWNATDDTGICVENVSSVSETGFNWNKNLNPEDRLTWVLIDNSSSYPRTNITLTACDCVGNCANDTITVRYTALPVAIIDKSYSRSGVYLDGRRSYDPDGGEIISYNWTYEVPSSSGKETLTDTRSNFLISLFKYPYVPGLYSVWLTVTDDEGQQGSNYTTYEICNSDDCSDPAITSTDIRLDKSTYYDGQNATATITIHNLGKLLPSDLLVRVYDTGKKIYEGTIDPNALGSCSQSENSVTYTLTVNWTVEYTGNPEHNLTVILDPDNAIGECNENNNKASRQFYVYSGPSCGIESDRDEIAVTSCSDYWDHICGSNILVKPRCCCYNNCTETCTTEAEITGFARNPSSGIIDHEVGSSIGNLFGGWSETDNEADYSGKFNSSDLGTAEITLSALFADGSSCKKSTQVLVTPTGHELDWADVGIENIEVVPTPLANQPSDVYVTVKNNGKVDAKGVNLIVGVPDSPTISCSDIGGAINNNICPTGAQSRAGSSPSLQPITFDLPPGEEKKVKIGTWTPNEKGSYCIVAYAAYVEDYDPTNNVMQKEIKVERGLEVGKTPVPEYPGITGLVGISLAILFAYLLTKNPSNKKP